MLFSSSGNVKSTSTIVIGLITAMFVFLGTYLVGHLGQSEARVHLEEMRPSLRFMCSAFLTVTSTILALLLTLLSFSSKTDRDIKASHYQRVQWIALLCAVTFFLSVLLLMVLSLPIKNGDVDAGSYYKILYYVLLGYGALLSGLMVTIIFLLYNAANAVILIYHPDKDAGHLFSSKEKEAIEEE